MAVAYTATINGNDYGFDFEDQRIDVDAALSTIPVADVYDAIKEAQATVYGIVYPVVAHAEGLTELGGNIQTYITVILQDNWALNSLKASGFVIINGGNLVRSDSGLIVRENPLITYFNQTSQAGVVFTVQVGSGLSTEEHNTLMGLLSNVKDSLLNRANTVAAGRITQYQAGTDANAETVDVTYDNDGIPTAEEIQ